MWGFNEDVNQPPHQRDPLRGDPSDPDRRPSFWVRYLLAVTFLGLIFAAALLAKYF